MNPLKLQALLWLTMAVSFLLGYDINTEGVVMVFPSEIAPGCNGDQLNVTCTTTGDFLQWNITLLESGPMINSYTRTFSADGPNPKQLSIMINSTMISFLRTSAARASLLTSTLVINPISGTFNRSRVECIELPRGTLESSFTIVHVMDFDYHYPEVNISSVSEQFGTNYVIVTLKWNSESSVHYNTSAVPQGAIKFNGSTTAQLTLSYNTLYNVSILAAVPCGLNTTTFIVLNYVKCRYPQVRNDTTSIMSHGKDPLIKGTTVHFTCPHGLEQIGPNTSTCMDNGVWVPDPMEVECRGETMSTEYTSLITIVSLVTITAFFLISIIMWMIGYFCGRCQYKQAPDTTVNRTSDSQQQIESSCLGALDEKMHNYPQEVGLDLTENVAYVSTQRITTQRSEPTT